MGAEAVWAAENGRCQVCERPMDRQMARIRAYDREALQTLDNTFLIFPICTGHWASPIPNARVRGDVAQTLSQARNQEKAMAALLREQLEAYGVLVGGTPKEGGAIGCRLCGYFGVTTSNCRITRCQKETARRPRGRQPLDPLPTSPRKGNARALCSHKPNAQAVLGRFRLEWFAKTGRRRCTALGSSHRGFSRTTG